MVRPGLIEMNHDDPPRSSEPPVHCVLLGGAGHAKVVIEAIVLSHRSSNRLSDPASHLCIVDSRVELHGQHLLGVPVVGSDDDLVRLRDEGFGHFSVSVGGGDHPAIRKRLFELALGHGLLPLTVIHPEAICSPSATIGDGCQVFARAVIQASVRVAENAMINTGAVVEHDCQVSAHAHVAPGATLCGGVVVEEVAMIGAGAVVLPGRRIGAGAMVGAGSVVTRDVPAGVTVVGNPAKPLVPARSEPSAPPG